MRGGLLVAAVFGLAVMASSRPTAQNRREEMNACFGDLIQRRVRAQQPVQLSAQTITLTGDTLRSFNQTAKRIQLVGPVNAFLGSRTDCGAPPRIEFR